MNDVFDGLIELFKRGAVDVEVHPSYQISFILGCGILAIIALICDLTFRHTTGGDSILGLRWDTWDRWFFFITYPIGAMGFGFVGRILHIIETSVMGCLVIGFAWHLVAKRIWAIIRKFAEEREG